MTVGPTDEHGTNDPRSRIATRTAASLAAAFGRLRFDGLQPQGATRLLTRATLEWAEQFGWLPVTEVPLAFLENTREQPGRQGVVDLYIARPGYRRDLVIEIDRGNKRWSAQKLGHAVANGKAAIWVRWRGPGPASEIVPPGVEVVYVDVLGSRIQAAEAVEDLRTVPINGGLSGASRVLLAALYPSEPPTEDDGWGDEAAIWSRVDALPTRLGLILRCRFGQHGPRPLTLARTAEVLADEMRIPVVTRERIRQLQIKALRQLRGRSLAYTRRLSQATGLPQAVSASPPPPPPPPKRATIVSSQGVDLDRPALHRMVVEIVGAMSGQPIRASMICHVLRGSTGPVTRDLIAKSSLPHDATFAQTPYAVLHDAVRMLANDSPLRLEDGLLSLDRSKTWASATRRARPSNDA